MEPVLATATAAVALLSGAALKSLGTKAGADSWKAVKSLFELVKSRFSGDPEAEKSLAVLGDEPQEEAAQESLQRMLAAYMLRDQEFQEELNRLVNEAAPRSHGHGDVNASVVKNAHVFNDRVEISGDWNSQ
ncbi:hypothetical protein [Nocardiopsis oceani]